jgi:hypothetical protein
MPEDTQFACTLTATGRTDREAEIRALAHDALLTVEHTVDMRFKAGPETLARVEALVAAESRCCSFLAFAVEHEADSIRLRISAPEGGEQVLAALATVAAEGTRT